MSGTSGPALHYLFSISNPNSTAAITRCTNNVKINTKEIKRKTHSLKFLCFAGRVSIAKPQETASSDGASQFGTFGCAAVDNLGNLAAATSIVDLVSKMVGTIGENHGTGAGTCANNICAVSATGIDKSITRATVACDVAALMEYKGLPLKEAAAYVIEKCVSKGKPGLSTGEVTMPFNTTGMYRACTLEDGFSEVAIW